MGRSSKCERRFHLWLLSQVGELIAQLKEEALGLMTSLLIDQLKEWESGGTTHYFLIAYLHLNGILLKAGPENHHGMLLLLTLSPMPGPISYGATND